MANGAVVAPAIGTVLGGRIASRVPADRLVKGFVVLLVVVATYTFGQSVLAPSR